MEPITLKVDPIEEKALMVNHTLIRKATDREISFLAKGPTGLKDISAIQKIKQSLLLLRGPMEGIVQQYEIGAIATLEGFLKDWVYKSY